MTLNFMSHCLTIIAFSIWAMAAAGPLHPQAARDQKQNQQDSSGKIVSAKTVLLSDEEVIEARRLLDQLGYWINSEVTGSEEARKDASLRHALTAFQKVEGCPLTGVLTQLELLALRAARKPRPLEPGFPHIEVDLSRQVLFLIDCDGVDLRVLPISSGSGELFTEGGVTRRAITPAGKFKIYRKINGWRKSPLGLLYYPNYINEGVAIHGAPSVPSYPASHGCIRIPIFAAKEFSAITTIGLVVIVYDSSGLETLSKTGKVQRSAE
jgi:N-acetylmuramoyl-L-alanine amidase